MAEFVVRRPHPELCSSTVVRRRRYTVAYQGKPTNEHIIELLDRVLEELGDLAERQKQIEADLSRMAADSTGN